MTCTDCAALSLRHESLIRECDRLRLDLKEADDENSGLAAEVRRLQDRCLALAAQVTEGIP